MNQIYTDIEYINLVNDIINNKNFIKIEESKHHGLSRLDHSLRVSYYSYKVTRFLKLDYRETARAGLLHDFFTNDELTNREKKTRAFRHHKKALVNARNNFYVSPKEEDIIISHMFPMVPQHIPRYLESWLVSLVDKIVAIYEYKLSYGCILREKITSYGFLIMLFCSRFNGL